MQPRAGEGGRRAGTAQRTGEERMAADTPQRRAHLRVCSGGRRWKGSDWGQGAGLPRSPGSGGGKGQLPPVSAGIEMFLVSLAQQFAAICVEPCRFR